MPERLVPPSETLNANGITLRRWRIGDGARLGAALRASLPHLAPWMSWATPDHGRAEDDEYLARAEKGWTEGTEFQYGVFAGNTVVGSAGLMGRIGPGALEIGYWVHVDHLRRGVATRTAAALAAAGLAIPGIDLIEIHHNPKNTASGGVPRTLGFTRADQGDGDAIWRLHAQDLPRSRVPDVLGQARYDTGAR